MEGSVGSRGVLKKKSSSGCLIIKNKSGDKNSDGGLGNLSDKKEKKRPRLVASSSGSSSSDDDECLEFMRRKINEKRLHNGSMRPKKDEFEIRECDRSNVGVEISGERKRSRLDLFEFDEYDDFDGKTMRNDYSKDRFEMVGRSGVGSKKNLVVKQGSCKGSSSVKSKGLEYCAGRNKGFESKNDEAHMPISLLKLKYQESADEPIRLQGKNGVLKVMVNKKKQMEFTSKCRNHDSKKVKERKVLKSDDVVKKESLERLHENRGLFVDKEKSVAKEKGKLKLEKVKPFSNKGRNGSDSEIDGTDTVLKLTPPGVKASSSKKRVKKDEELSSSPEKFTPSKRKEGKEEKAKRAGSTEKQMLREKIRGMLIDAGWTIDYRPRRNRDYLDSVYINPSGTAYWSIVKAYDAFKKQSEEDNGNNKSDVGSPISEGMINKLTRQTKKKIEQEMTRKRKEDVMIKSGPKFAESSDSDQNEERLSSYIKQKYKFKRGKLCNVDQEKDDDLRDDSSKRKPAKTLVEKPSNYAKSNVIQGRTSKIIGRCTLLVRGENSDSDGYVPYSGKRTVLAWLIDSGTAKLSEKVQYMNRRRTRVMLKGWITRDGIHCGCCSKILAVSKFELHAGSKSRQAFQNIVLESGSSLLQCQIDAWNKQDESMLPSGDWHCPNCTCKFCGQHASGNVSDENDSTCDELNKCSFFHKSCSEKVYALPMSSNGASFCGLKCQEIYDHLQKILGVKNELESGFSWSLIQRSNVSDTTHRGFSQRVECNSKLAVAASVMDECFLPIVDRRSGINIIHNVVYNCRSNFNRLNYHGFYTAILERGDEIISAASIRIHGTRLAEMPFIGTRGMYRRQGMCRLLLSAIETELRSLKVEQLVVPAISEHTNTWTTVFGFHELEDVHKKGIKSLNMLVFPGTDMLQKQLLEQEISNGKTFLSFFIF
ncbi:hypothetical protein BUALT_Bualt12G0132000 [Buddleja alternifolia]|uniref:N-acetyltransferase domain-containing protein n=1 Tax=Buddleja alternifolia TaxID=168488 RepID=A0AAV6X1P8_9LAMI|nr:hypothetical protein BUALT_Bualt12G0132000 [Buddleja alternifolia]